MSGLEHMLSLEMALELGHNKQVVVIAMDAGNEIDDEIVAHLLMKHYQRGKTVFFAQVPGATIDGNSSDAMRRQVALTRVQRMRDVFPEQFGKKDIWSPTIPNFDNKSTFILCLLEDLLAMVNHGDREHERRMGQPFQVEYFLQIAPLIGFTYFQFVAFSIKHRIVMGDLKNPEKSINCTKAIPSDESGNELRATYESLQITFDKISEKTTSISTDFARKVATPISFINGLPDTMSISLLNTAFMQFVGRPNPKRVWAEDISKVNHKTILNMLPKNILYDILSNPTEQRLVDMVIRFLEPEITSRNPENPFDEFYPLRLGQIATAVEWITGVKYESEGDPRYLFTFNESVDSLEDSTLAKKNWLKYITKNNCDLTPFYDGLTVLCMMENDKGNDMPSVERCKELILSL